MGLNLETFEIGNDLADIGGDEIDLSQIAVTDTLIGKTMVELTSALGEPSLNEFEKYHLGDAGISDINIGAFDSALIQDSGIKPYTIGEEINEDAAELAEVMQTTAKVADVVKEAVSSVLKNSDKETKRILDKLTLEDFDYEDDFIGDDGEPIVDDDDEDIFAPLADDHSDDWSIEEIEELTEDYINGKIDRW